MITLDSKTKNCLSVILLRYKFLFFLLTHIVFKTSFGSIITVTNTNDSGPGSLRDVVSSAASGDSIVFDITGTITLTNGEINYNKDITFFGPGACELSISGNKSSSIFFIMGGTTVINDITLKDAIGSNQGGAIRCFGKLILKNSIITNCKASNGPFVYFGSAITLTMDNCILSNDTAVVRGIILNGNPTSSDTIIISNTTFENNSGNVFDIWGDGASSFLKISNSTFSGNAGAMIIEDYIDIEVLNTTFSGNTATLGYGFASSIYLIENWGIPILTTKNSIYNDIPNNVALVGGATVVSAGNNISDDNSFSTYFIATGDMNMTNPMLGSLAFNGGFGRTHSLLAGSPAIDPASSNGAPVIDQRGATRVGNADIGSFEYNSVVAVLSTSGNVTICFGETANLSVSGASSHIWSPASFLNMTTGTNVISSPTVVGTITYTVTGTDIHGCNRYSMLSVKVNSLPTILVTPNSVMCNGDPPFVIGAAGAVNYTWSPSTGLSSTTGSSTNATPPLGINTYSVTGMDGNGCINFANTTIIVNPGPTLSVISNASICYGTSTMINASSGNVTSYTWSPGSGLSSDTGASITASPSVSLTYTVTGTNTCGSATGMVLVTVKPLPSFVVIASSTFLCPGTSGTIGVAGSTTSYIWSPSESLSASVGTSVTASPTITTIYNIIGINSCGTYTVNMQISVGTLPTIYPSNNATICSGETANLNVSGATSYVWTPSDGLTFTIGSITQANPTITTTYTITGIVPCGLGVAYITVSVLPIPLLVVTDNATICSGYSTVLSASGAFDYSWSPATGLDAVTGATVISSVLSSTTYNVTGTSIDGCTSGKSIIVKVNNNPNIDAGNNVTIVLGETATLQGNGGTTYLWNPSNNLSCTNCQVTIANPPITTQYYLTVTDDNGCVNKDSVLVSVICDYVFVPDAFSPNNDGQNDVLIMYSYCVTTLISFDIYDRWGGKVFSTSDIKQGWDGTFKGVQMPNAVFCYYLKAWSTQGGNEIKQKGNISLIR